jgi:hypothetical protein
MKYKSIVTAGILFFAFYLHGQNADTSTNPPVRTASMSTMTSSDYVNHFGIGAEFGEPIGVTAKYWLNDFIALDAAGGWSPAPHSVAEVHMDLLFHDFNLLTAPEGKMPVYIGGGLLGRFRDDGRSDLGGWRFPLGVSYMFDNCPVDIFAEVAPEIIFAPFARGGIDGVVGVRFWF